MCVSIVMSPAYSECLIFGIGLSSRGRLGEIIHGHTDVCAMRNQRMKEMYVTANCAAQQNVFFFYSGVFTAARLRI